MKRIILLLVTLSVALAGCADNGDTPSLDDAAALQDDLASGESLGSGAARTLIEEAVDALPGRYGFTFEATKNGNPLMRADGTFDDATQESYIDVSGSAAAFGGMRALADGLTIYASAEGAAYRFGDLALVQAATVQQLDGVVPAVLFTPATLLEELKTNLTVERVAPAAWEGQPALDVTFTVTDEARSIRGTLTALQDPPRIVRLVATLPQDREMGPISGADIDVTLAYETSAAPIPADAARLLGLGHAVDGAPNANQTWTFMGAGTRTPLADLELRVYDATRVKGAPGDATPALSLVLSDGEATAHGITIAFDDADGDNTASAGDRLTLRVGDDATLKPHALLHDTQTSAYVTGDLLVVFQAVMGGF